MFRWIAVFVLAVASAGVRAAPAAAVPPAEQRSLDAFAAANAACRAWSDGCVVCRRTEANGFGCSTPGIACLPKPLACEEPTPASPRGNPR